MTLQELALWCLERPTVRTKAIRWKGNVGAEVIAWLVTDPSEPLRAPVRNIQEAEAAAIQLRDPLSCLALATGAP